MRPFLTVDETGISNSYRHEHNLTSSHHCKAIIGYVPFEGPLVHLIGHHVDRESVIEWLQTWLCDGLISNYSAQSERVGEI